MRREETSRTFANDPHSEEIYGMIAFVIKVRLSHALCGALLQVPRIKSLEEQRVTALRSRDPDLRC